MRRHAASLHRATFVLITLVTARPPHGLSAQAPPAPQAPQAPSPDTTRAPVAPDTARRVRPMGAFWRSFLVPGWGQAKTGRQTAGALFAVWEGTCAMMTLKAQSEANYLKATGSKNLGAKRQQVQDWLVLWIFNHLFSGAEAFVSAHLQDFPGDLKVRAYPGGVGLTLPLPRGVAGAGRP